MALTLAELQKKLLEQPTGEVRAGVAQEIAAGFVARDFTASERALAVEIFRLLVNDVEVQVRRMLSEQLAQSMDAPRDIVLKLAHDISEVALPVLEKSYVLTEEDLIEIADSTKDVAIMSGIARRDSVSRDLSETLLKKSNAQVIEILLQNKSAIIDEDGFNHIYAACASRSSVLELMVKRGGLPVMLAEKLFVAVTDEMKAILTQQYKLSVEMADSSTKSVREFATLGMLDDNTGITDIAKLINHLYLQGRLTLSMIIRALCMGDLRFFEYALAKLADVPITNAQLLVLDQSEKGFESLYKTSCLPMELFPATQYLLKIALEETNFGRYRRNDFKNRVAGRLMRDESARKIEYMDYLLVLIQNNVPDAAMAS